MNETGRQWEGQVVAGKFQLRAYLGGSERGCCFLTGREGQQAVIKLIRANEPQAEDQLLRWAQAASLSHPNLVQTFEAGQCRIGDADLIYVMMERADETLAEILPQRALTPAEAGQMLTSVLEALAYLHGQGFAHGRLKPSNILAVGDQVKISSDGICAIGTEQSRPSVHNAPEAASGKCSAATDVWSLGMTLAQALTQQVPRWQESNRDPIFSGPVPQPFLDIACNCLRRDPLRRWTTADISARLRPSSPAPGGRAVEPQATREIMPPRAPANWRHRVPPTVLIALAVMVIVLAPKIMNRFQNRHGEVAALKPTPTAAKTKTSRSPSPAEAETAHPHPAEASPADKSLALKEPNRSATPPATPVDVSAGPEKPRTEAGLDEVIKRVMPEVPQKARDTIRGTVRVGIRVEVSPSGEVTAISLDAPGPSKYFVNLAVSAARQWKFAPAPADGGSAARTWILRFEFTRDATQAFPTRLRQ